MNNRRFTLEEANAMLPRLREDLAKLQELVKQFEGLYQELKQAKAEYLLQPAGQEGGDPFFEMEGRLDFLRMEAELFIENFTRQGVLLKMIKPGLIDFPAVVDGEEVLICWKEGEERITHYHGWHDGFAGRKPFPGAY
ncbi:DUF2203 domain-containing protein [Paenibacillus mucilaginosus]|uniref:DivIVA family protein n=1 Tax=Paenibacillus mucilaginosus (strain KNP414) TaxID=1036673 RepID=F8F5D8_PAEMK|nr:DUF2203 domain-containing protein [Paenibacillus mucilaginosus]AEI40949.1 DivIVA family protein [Paenibacillus mucilaginosus KNP414]MCG7211600.1 DUF2203 domain-containing protein [Paenibacillus mucilaginosus]WDM30036.1 DUF2203 domain-containing protein [Paenibacillus mucilaginosus]